MTTERQITSDVDAEIARLVSWREREVQALGAAFSRRDWHAAEVAYNEENQDNGPDRSRWVGGVRVERNF